MYIYNIGAEFNCPSCGIRGRADVSSDFVRTDEGYFIICPVCGKRTPIKDFKIPAYLIPYIRYESYGIGAHHE